MTYFTYSIKPSTIYNIYAVGYGSQLLQQDIEIVTMISYYYLFSTGCNIYEKIHYHDVGEYIIYLPSDHNAAK